MAGDWGQVLAQWVLELWSATDLYALASRREGPDAALHFLLDVGDWCLRELERPTAWVEAPEALAHGNRGRKPAHTIPESIRQQVVHLAKSTYKGCNYMFLSELLHGYQGISLSTSSVRRILKAKGIDSPRKHRPPKRHHRRQRKSQFGMLIQVDGSHHDWLDGRGPWLVLHGAIDDATSSIVALTFRRTECFNGCRDMFEQLVTTHGIPLATYSDRHSLFFPPERWQRASLEQQLKGQKPLSQVGRMIVELGCGHIPALPPQAKGRIERLWGTLQERLVVYLRLMGAKTLEQAEAASLASLSGTTTALPSRPLRRMWPSNLSQPTCAWNTSCAGRSSVLSYLAMWSSTNGRRIGL